LGLGLSCGCGCYETLLVQPCTLRTFPEHFISIPVLAVVSVAGLKPLNLGFEMSILPLCWLPGHRKIWKTWWLIKLFLRIFTIEMEPFKPRNSHFVTKKTYSIKLFFVQATTLSTKLERLPLSTMTNLVHHFRGNVPRTYQKRESQEGTTLRVGSCQKNGIRQTL
jgi:hypothetical protein